MDYRETGKADSSLCDENRSDLCPGSLFMFIYFYLVTLLCVQYTNIKEN